MEKLSQAEINRRMTQWRNDRLLEPKRKKRMKELEDRCAFLETENAELKRTVEMLCLRIEQLEKIIFGQKKGPDGQGGSRQLPAQPKMPKKERNNASFRRAIPTAEEITDHTHHSIDICPACTTPLRRKMIIVRYVEDIPDPQKMVTKQMIEKGYCPQCRLWKSAIPISPQHCTLGPNVRTYVALATSILGQTFGKMNLYLRSLHRLSVSDGEIAAIIRSAHRTLLPEKQGIRKRIAAATVSHFDESPYPVQHGMQGNYAWVKTSADGPDTEFLFGRTRGKGNAEELCGPLSDQVGVTDDYGAYDNLFRHHALCWAHPLRKFRDLAESGALTQEHHRQCVDFYERFHALQRSVASVVTSPFRHEERMIAAETHAAEIAVLMTPDPEDLPKLATYKSTFLEHREKYLLCIRMAGVPMTNNKAERSIRPLVIKRLLSFGSRSQQGAEAMETIFSVCFTLLWRKPEDYFGELRLLMTEK